MLLLQGLFIAKKVEIKVTFISSPTVPSHTLSAPLVHTHPPYTQRVHMGHRNSCGISAVLAQCGSFDMRRSAGLPAE